MLLVLAAAPAIVSYAAAAVATLALLISVWRFWAEFPRLDLRQEPLVDAHGAPLEVAKYHDGIVVDSRQYVRARVHNKSWLGTARGTQVLAYIEPIEEIGYKGLDIRPLRWVSAEENDNPVTALDIPPGVDRHIDLAVCKSEPSPGTDDQTRSAAEARKATVGVAREPAGEGHRLPVGQTIPLLLVVACGGRRAGGFEVKVEFDGENLLVNDGPRRRKRGS